MSVTGYYLLENPNPNGDHFYRTRRGTVLAIVVHVTAGLEDLDGSDDLSAEKTAAYAASTNRAVSWHSGSDTDTSLDLLPAAFTAFHVQGYNSRTYGHEISKATPDWRTPTDAWIDATLRRAASHLAVRARELGVPVRRSTRDELDTAIARNSQPVGFIGHYALDPTRRRDPGMVGTADTFPWGRFLDLVLQYQQPSAPAVQPPPGTVSVPYVPQEDDMQEPVLVTMPPANGYGMAELHVDFGRPVLPVSVVSHGPDPDVDGWWADTSEAAWRVQPRGNGVVVTVSRVKNSARAQAWVTVR